MATTTTQTHPLTQAQVDQLFATLRALRAEARFAEQNIDAPGAWDFYAGRSDGLGDALAELRSLMAESAEASA